VDAGQSGKTTNVENSATGAVIGTVPNMGTLETRRAIELANAALPAWRSKTAKARSAILRKWLELIMAN
jgi:succinate-semialdehyde dehydrogenase/glutarate-semialdehyde dehydrogenase